MLQSIVQSVFPVYTLRLGDPSVPASISLPQTWNMSRPSTKFRYLAQHIYKLMQQDGTRFLHLVSKAPDVFREKSEKESIETIIRSLRAAHRNRLKSSANNSDGSSSITTETVPPHQVPVSPSLPSAMLDSAVVRSRDDNTFASFSHQCAVVNSMLSTVFKLKKPHYFQVYSVALLRWTSLRHLLLVRKTGEGKSAIIMSLAILFGGVTLSLVPLVGLGADQSTKAKSFSHIESIHLNSIHGNEKSKLMNALTKIRGSRKAVIIYLSPRCLTKDSKWFPVLSELVQSRIVRFFAHDEIHTLATDGEAYRPEFKDMCKDFFPLLLEYRTKILGLTASCTLSIKNRIEGHTKIPFQKVFWGPMEKTNIFIKVTVPSSNQFWDCTTRILLRFLSCSDSKVILYTNFKARAIKKWIPFCDKFLASREVVGTAVTLHGDTGISMKSALVEWFSSSNTESPFHIPILIATAAANCGISSTYARLALRDGIVPSMVELFQELGRIGRTVRTSGLLDCYHMLLTVSSVRELTIRNHGGSSKGKVKTAMNNMLDCLAFFCLPTKCYHLQLQDHFCCPNEFKNDQIEELPPFKSCADVPGAARCSFCSGTHMETFVQPNKEGLIDVLTTQAFNDGPMRIMELPTILLRNKKHVWRSRSDLVRKEHADAITLQLLAARIVSLFVQKSDNTRNTTIVKCRLVKEDIKPDEQVNRMSTDYVHNNPTCWKGIV